MKFSCDKNILQEAIAVTARAVPSKSPINSLEGLLIECGESVKITGYDLKKAIYTVFDADVVQKGQIVVNARLFSEMIRRLPDGIVLITADEENNSINVKCGRSEYNFIGYDVKDYPDIPKFEGMNNVCIPQNQLKKMIEKTIFAVSKDEVRPVYTGSLFEIEGNTLTIVSVDGYRLARRIEKIENAQLEDCSFVVPGFALSDIEKICEEKDEPVKIAVGDKHISFTIGDTVVISRRLEGDFLNHKKSVPDEFRYELTVDRHELTSVIDRVALMLSDKAGNPVRMTFGDGVIDCNCVTPLGKADDMCPCTGSGEDLLIGFNDRYLTDALKAADGDSIKVCLNTSSSPCVIKSSDGEENYTYMILPVRLHK